MTLIGHMRKIGIAELKAHLSAHLRAIRKGQTLTVIDRDTPIATIVPYREPTAPRLQIREQLHTAPLPAPLPNAVDSLAALIDERRERR
jgi:antitoxin (DNA-binding transcriptional repressor) of toxin-antitoxin stability system